MLTLAYVAAVSSNVESLEGPAMAHSLTVSKKAEIKLADAQYTLIWEGKITSALSLCHPILLVYFFAHEPKPRPVVGGYTLSTGSLGAFTGPNLESKLSADS